MKTLATILIGFSALGFVLAVIAVVAVGDAQILGVPAEAYSRGCTNLALIAIALAVWFK